MAKVGTLQQGYVGKLNGQAYYKGADGKTVVRNITTPKNPKTLAQRVQRVIAKTVNAQYKQMKAIADHSFEGRSMGYECMNRFKQANMNGLRERAAAIQNAGGSLYEFYNFMQLKKDKFMPAAVIISEGQLNEIKPVIINSNGYRGALAVAENTYQAVINAVGGQRGDQLSFLTVEKDLDGNYKFHFARVILDPRNVDGSGAALSSAFISGSAINMPSPRNSGNFGSLTYADGNIVFTLADDSVCAVAIIASRKASDSTWLRSNAKFVLSEGAIGTDLMSLMDAADDRTMSLDLNSEAFLNNAGTGGAQGQAQEATGGETGTTDPILSMTARINNVTQNISGGSTTVVDALTSVHFEGSNLSSGPAFKMTKNGGADVAPTTATDSAIDFTITGSAVNDIYRFYQGSSLKLTVTVVQASSGEEGGL